MPTMVKPCRLPSVLRPLVLQQRGHPRASGFGVVHAKSVRDFFGEAPVLAFISPELSAYRSNLISAREAHRVRAVHRLRHLRVER
jgi:hypothetical protein